MTKARDAAAIPQYLLTPFSPSPPFPTAMIPTAINGQQSSPRSHLVGRVGEFEGELNYYLPLRFRTHPDQPPDSAAGLSSLHRTPTQHLTSPPLSLSIHSSPPLSLPRQDPPGASEPRDAAAGLPSLHGSPPSPLP
ncbi:unnamed protein product [Closterium sp. Naga37s-1]|nr:unnamed protein product [Closterium sp. Naga37s-1]CAI5518431.1 unnamed protein product [Closterium sp. Naga37s-1]